MTEVNKKACPAYKGQEIEAVREALVEVTSHCCIFLCALFVTTRY